MPHTPTDDALAARLDLLASRWAIHDLVSNYCHGMDKHDLERFSSVWHEDARFMPGEQFGVFEGRAAIERAAQELIWPGLPTTRHHTVNLVVTFDGDDKATGLSDVSGWRSTPPAPGRRWPRPTRTPTSAGTACGGSLELGGHLLGVAPEVSAF